MCFEHANESHNSSWPGNGRWHQENLRIRDSRRQQKPAAICRHSVEAAGPQTSRLWWSLAISSIQGSSEIQFAGGFPQGLWLCSKHSQYLRTPALVQDSSHAGPALVMNYTARALPGTQGSFSVVAKEIKTKLHTCSQMSPLAWALLSQRRCCLQLLSSSASDPARRAFAFMTVVSSPRRWGKGSNKNTHILWQLVHSHGWLPLCTSLPHCAMVCHMVTRLLQWPSSAPATHHLVVSKI